ncbi:MAG TPA: helix-turn-helix domain-containing protein [Sporosarcina psychrophila]|uniref:Helix-turn-helix domain-containing protein n=1 Tax=Sporosarcina psychrophila TaxID=1476 RepID=A0A921G3K1_SPOPS|nr:helix-turn-helix domain-containing protein [Sporosarcina psychrophila]
MNIGSIVKYYRLRNGLTQAELSNGICSISHLSKIESNKYSPHKETLEELFKKMHIEWEKEVVGYKKFEEKLSRFISHSVYYDFESMETLYKELKENEDYLQSTDLVNKYELYKLRYYLYKRDTSQAKRQHQLVEKLRPTFNDYERIVAKVISIMFYISIGEDERAEQLFAKIDEDAERIPKLLEGEYFYQRAWLLHKKTKYGKSSYYAEMAVEHFLKDFNYIRLMHAQLLLAINFTSRDLYLQSEKLFTILMRNTQMMGQGELYQHTLYNLSVLYNRMGNHTDAYELLVELKSIISVESGFYDAVLLNMLHTSLEAGIDSPNALEELKVKMYKSKDPYLEIHYEYYKKTKFSQQELYDYSENIMFPFLRKYGYIEEGRRIAWRLARYYKEKEDYEKVDFFSDYYYAEGDKEL